MVALLLFSWPSLIRTMMWRAGPESEASHWLASETASYKAVSPCGLSPLTRRAISFQLFVTRLFSWTFWLNANSMTASDDRATALRNAWMDRFSAENLYATDELMSRTRAILIGRSV